MRKVSLSEDVISITEKFIKHLESLERMVEYSNLIEKEYKVKNEDGNNINLGKIADLIVLAKSIEIMRENDSEIKTDDTQYKDDSELLEQINEMKSENKLIKFMYNNIFVTESEHGYHIESNSTFVNNIIDAHINKSSNMDSDINQLLNSIIISLVTGMELLIADLFKDFIQNVDQSEFINTKTLSYNELVKIGTVEEARIFLIDEYTEGLLKQSFKYWIEEIEKRIKLKIKSNPFFDDQLEKIFEVFQRRHLLIHNNGIINSLYLSKVHQTLTRGLEKDDVIEIDKKYIQESINLFRSFGLVLSYKYAEKKHRQEKDDIFINFNNLLLKPSTRGCLGARNIFKDISKDLTYNHQSRLMAEINYYLNFKHIGDFENIIDDVENFDVSTLSVEYKMAKDILLDKLDSAFEHFKTFSTTLNDNEFIVVSNWPLIKLARKSEQFVEFIQGRLESIVSSEEAETVGT